MAGTKAGGLKAAATNKRLYGDDFYKRMGRSGGIAWTDKPKGFAANPELAKRVGREIGRKTKRGYKWLGDSQEKGYGMYIRLDDEMVVKLKYGKNS